MHQLGSLCIVLMFMCTQHDFLSHSMIFFHSNDNFLISDQFKELKSYMVRIIVDIYCNKTKLHWHRVGDK